MEGFEHIVKVAMEAEGFIVSGNLKSPLKERIKKEENKLMDMK